MAISKSEIPAVPMTELAKSKYFSRPPASENVLFKLNDWQRRQFQTLEIPH